MSVGRWTACIPEACVRSYVATFNQSRTEMIFLGGDKISNTFNLKEKRVILAHVTIHDLLICRPERQAIVAMPKSAFMMKTRNQR